MKKILLFSIISYFSVLGVFAQSIKLQDKSGNNIDNGDTIVMVSTDSHAIFAIGLDVINTTSGDLAVWAKKTELSIIPGSENYFCWVSCYIPSIFISPDSLIISGNTTFKMFSGDYEANGNVGASYIMYTFFNDAKHSDSIAVVVKYVAGSGVGIDNSMPNIQVSNLYPNPANNKVSINYDLNGANNARLEIRNILGSVVKSVEINETNGQVNIDVSNLTNGVYFYSFIVNDIAIKSTKLVIQH
jgi:hypothetical protein